MDDVLSKENSNSNEEKFPYDSYNLNEEIENNQGDQSLSNVKTQRRSKNDKEGRIYKCQCCEKNYLSYPALYTHTKTKHKESNITTKSDKEKQAGSQSKGRGRPKKIIGKCEILLQDFFSEDKTNNCNFQELNQLYDKTLNEIKASQNINIFKTSENELTATIKASLISEEEKKLKAKKKENNDQDFTSIDSILGKYLVETSKCASMETMKAIIGIILLFRDCLNKHGWLKSFQLLEEEQAIVKDGFIYLTKEQVNKMENNEFCTLNNGELLPDLVEIYITSYNINWCNFTNNREWLIQLLENFCKWLFLKGYTCAKLNRIDNIKEESKNYVEEQN